MTSKERRIEYIEKHVRWPKDRELLVEAFLEQGGLHWLTEDQLADMINLLNGNYRRTQRMNRQNMKRLAEHGAEIAESQ